MTTIHTTTRDIHLPDSLDTHWQQRNDMSNETTPSECTCKDAFGQLIWNDNCAAHDRCQWTMPGIPIRCVLTDRHKGDHK